MVPAKHASPTRTHMNVQFGLLVLIVSFAISRAADYAPDVTKWVTIERPPEALSDAYWAFFDSASSSKSEWSVSREGDTVTAHLAEDAKRKIEVPEFSLTAEEPDKDVESTKHILRVNDGWLVGYNAGEFGASLWWYSTDGKSHRKISDHQINQFITTQNGIFAVEGLAHFETRGSMIRLLQDNGKWTAKIFVPLPQSAEAIAVLPDGAFVVVTTDMLLRITPEREICVLVSNGAWGGFYPNSVAVSPAGRIYIGMRQFVVAHDLSDKDQKLEFLVPDSSFLHVEK